MSTDENLKFLLQDAVEINGEYIIKLTTIPEIFKSFFLLSMI